MNGQKIYNNRWKVLGGIIAVLALLTASIFLLTGDGEEGDGEVVFVNRSAYVRQRESGETEIDLSEFSGEEADTQKKTSGSYVYEEGRYMTEFSYMGIYRGDVFTKVKKSGGQPVMVMSEDFDPYDGTINSYMTARIVDRNGTDTIQTNIYVDRDFREFADSELFIAWGENFGNYRPFRFKQVAPNTYMDTVYDSGSARLVHGSTLGDANFAVGTFSKEDVQNKEVDVRAAVFMK